MIGKHFLCGTRWNEPQATIGCGLTVYLLTTVRANLRLTRASPMIAVSSRQARPLHNQHSVLASLSTICLGDSRLLVEGTLHRHEDLSRWMPLPPSSRPMPAKRVAAQPACRAIGYDHERLGRARPHAEAESLERRREGDSGRDSTSHQAIGEDRDISEIDSI